MREDSAGCHTTNPIRGELVPRMKVKLEEVVAAHVIDQRGTEAGNAGPRRGERWDKRCRSRLLKQGRRPAAARAGSTREADRA